jgi:hypothetical protein
MQQKLFLFVLIISFFTSFGQNNTDQKNDETVHILFVGNSLTYTNNLTKLVKKKAKTIGINVKTKLVAYPNYALIDHWNDGKVQKLIASKKFDYVIIQQGPSSQNEGRQMLIEDGKKYSNLCKLNNVKLCYFMVWPSLVYYHTFDGVIKNHQDAATINNAILLPVGEVWKDDIENSNSYEYYSSDGFHPSKKGSQIAAKVIVEHLFN